MNQDAEPGVIASSNPSDLPWEHVYNTSLPLSRVWGTVGHEVSRLVSEHSLPATLISNHQISRGGNDPADWICVGIDVSEPVIKADAKLLCDNALKCWRRSSLKTLLLKCAILDSGAGLRRNDDGSAHLPFSVVSSSCIAHKPHRHVLSSCYSPT